MVVLYVATAPAKACNAPAANTAVCDICWMLCKVCTGASAIGATSVPPTADGAGACADVTSLARPSILPA